MVKDFKPKESAGITASYDKIINKYVSVSKWEKRGKSKDLVYVDVKGSILNTNRKRVSIIITFIIKPIEGKDDWFQIDPYFIDLNEKGIGETKALSFIIDLINAYNEGYNTMADYYDNNISRDSPF
jgi:hypothetical protein